MSGSNFPGKRNNFKNLEQKNLLQTKNLILIFNPLFGSEKYIFDPSQQTSNKGVELDAILKSKRLEIGNATERKGLIELVE